MSWQVSAAAASGLAAAAALAFGVNDGVGGLIARRLDARALTGVVSATGFVAAAAALAAFARPDAWSARDAGLGALSGLVGAAGLVLLYRALASGAMAAAAPVASTLATALPVILDVARGTRLPPIGWLGIGMSLTTIALISGGAGGRADRRAVLVAAGAGTGFALSTILFSATAPASGIVPLATSRLAGTLLVAPALRPSLLAGRGRLVSAGVVMGLADAVAGVLVLVALQSGRLAVVASLLGLVPATTVAFATLFLREVPSRRRFAGLAAACAAAVLLALAS